MRMENFLSKKKYLQVLFIILFLSGNLLGQFGPDAYNHPELDWYTIETEHFFVHFHKGTDRTAKVIAKIAEDIYTPVTSLYEYEADSKIHFIIKDYEDYSNGAAFYYDNKIEIWASAMDFELRGSHNWLRNVITHEFTHMIQIGASRKITRHVPAVYFQAIAYETERREDVIRGAPNTVVSYPIAMTVMPSWYAEGVAQFQITGLDYEDWDAHRDMILRTSVLEDKVLTYTQMGGFGKNSIGNEKVYNHGYAFVGYLVKNFGLKSLQQISKEMKGFHRVTIDGAMEKVTGKSASTLYNDWIEEITAQYKSQLRDITENRVEGEIIEKKGIGNFNPTWGPDDISLVYLSSFEHNRLSSTGFKAVGPLVKNNKKKKLWVSHDLDWSPDGKRLAYAHKDKQTKSGSRFFDIYIYDLQREKEERITRGLRAHSPTWSPDAQELIFIVNNDGTENLVRIELETKKLTYLTDFKYGEQIAHPDWSPDGQQVLYSTFINSGQDLFLLDLETNKTKPLLADEYDSRDGVYSPDGKKVYFSWDKTGIFNIYEMDLETKGIDQLTNVVGGAFMPSVNRKGELLFSTFTADGYKIAKLENPKPINPEKANYAIYANETQLASADNSFSPSAIEKIKAPYYDDTKFSNYEVSPYKTKYSDIAFMPRVMVDYGTLKLGTYAYSYEVLEKFGFLAGFDLNSRLDYDLFALVEYKKFSPTIFAEFYNQVQNIKFDVDSTEQIVRGIFNLNNPQDKFKYNLMEINIGLDQKIINRYHTLRASFIHSRYATSVKFQAPVGEQTFKYKYFLGYDLSLKYTYDTFGFSRFFEIDPKGRFFEFRYEREFNKFLVDFATERVVSAEIFENYNYNKLTLNYKENIPFFFKGHTLNLDVNGGFIDTKVDSFFNFFAGGIIGNRGYPYYSIEGRKMLQGKLTYRFPLFNKLDMRFMHLYFDKVYLSAFYDYGNAFDEDKIDFGDFKSSVGGELRMDSFSFYSFPTKLFFSAAYGLDRFEFADQVYGKDWRFYFGVSFGYLE